MDEKRFLLSDRLWERFAPLLHGKASDSGVPAGDNRLFFWRLCSGGFALAQSAGKVGQLEQPVSPVPALI